MTAAPLPLPATLANATLDAQGAVRALATASRFDLSALPQGALAYLVARAVQEHSVRFLLLAPDAESASKLDADLRFFLQGAQAPDGGGRMRR